jgi:hypothetical protein
MRYNRKKNETGVFTMIKNLIGRKRKTAVLSVIIAGFMLTSTVLQGDWQNDGNSTVSNTGVIITGRNPISSVNGFYNCIQFSNLGHSALVYEPGTLKELMFGFHGNGNFYWGSGENGVYTYPMTLNKNGSLSLKGNLVLQGSNQWIYHTPDDGRTSLYIAPYTNNAWDWAHSTRFDNNGNVNFTGTITAANYACSSDSRYKKNISEIDTPLAKLLSLNGITYNWDTEKYKQFTDKRDVGFLAQDVEKVFPEIVYTDHNGYKSVAYDKITVVIVEAMKEMKSNHEAKISSLEKENAVLKEKLASLEKMSERLVKIEKMMQNDKLARN